MSDTGQGETGLSIRGCLAAISARLTDAAAIARAAVTCAETGSDREALRIVLDLDEHLSEAATLHGAVCLLGRMRRKGRDPAD